MSATQPEPSAPSLLDEGPDRRVTLEPGPAEWRLHKQLREPSRLRRLGSGRRARAEFAQVSELASRGLPLPRPLGCERTSDGWSMRFALEPLAPLSTWLQATADPAQRSALLASLAALLARLQDANVAWPQLGVDSFGVSRSFSGSASDDAAVCLLGWHGMDPGAGPPDAKRRREELASLLGPLRALLLPAERHGFLDAYRAALAPPVRAQLDADWEAALRSAARRAARAQLSQRLAPEWPTLPGFLLERSPHATTLRRDDLASDYPKAVQRALDDRPRRSFHSPTGLSAQGAGNAIELCVDAEGPERVLILSGLAWDRTRARFFEAVELERLGVPTTSPLVLRSGSAPSASFALPVGYSDLALALAEADADVRRSAPRALGTLLARLHDCGLSLASFRPRDIFISVHNGDALFGPALPTQPFDPERETSDEARFGTLVGFLTAAEKTVTPGERLRFLAAYRRARRRLS